MCEVSPDGSATESKILWCEMTRDSLVRSGEYYIDFTSDQTAINSLLRKNTEISR